MKERIKLILGKILYWLYQKNILKNRLHVYTIDETIDELTRTEKSIVRFGDRELIVIARKDSLDQTASKELSESLAEIMKFEDENLMVAIPDIFDGMPNFKKASKEFWMKHLLQSRREYYKYCDTNKKYYNAFMSRGYYIYDNHEHTGEQFDHIRNIWKDKKIIVVEGEATHNGVGNDLLSLAKETRRILCPSKNAFDCYEEILQSCLQYDKEWLFLISLGATAKSLAFDLYKRGYRVLDIGNLDLEYEWFLRGADGKVPIPKHSVIGEEANRKAGYDDYLQEVEKTIILPD